MRDSVFDRQWAQMQSRLQEQLSRLANPDVAGVNGPKRALVAELKSQYDETRDMAEQRLEQFEGHARRSVKSRNSRDNDTSSRNGTEQAGSRNG